MLDGLVCQTSCTMGTQLARLHNRLYSDRLVAELQKQDRMLGDSGFNERARS